MIYLKNPQTGEIAKFRDINSIGAGYDNWVNITETTQWHGYEHKLIQEQYTSEATRRRNNIIEKGKIQITTDAGVLWHIKINKVNWLDLLGADFLFRLVDDKTQGQFYCWRAKRNIIITYNDLKKLATEMNKYTNKTQGGDKNIYTIQEQIIAKVYEYTTYEAISSLEAERTLHNELGKFDPIETELMMNEASAPTVEIPVQGDAGVNGNL